MTRRQRVSSVVYLAGTDFGTTSAGLQLPVFDNPPVVVRQLFAQMRADQRGIVRMNEKRRVPVVRRERGDRFANDRQAAPA